MLFPTRPNEPKLVGIPLANPMGWVSSPPNFLAATETIADLANAALASPNELAAARRVPHRFDVLSESNLNSDTKRPDNNDLNTSTTKVQSSSNLDLISDAASMQNFFYQNKFFRKQKSSQSLKCSQPFVLRWQSYGKFKFAFRAYGKFKFKFRADGKFKFKF